MLEPTPWDPCESLSVEHSVENSIPTDGGAIPRMEENRVVIFLRYIRGITTPSVGS